MWQELNARFRAGQNGGDTGSSLSQHGILLHYFDYMDDPDPNKLPWVPGRGIIKWYSKEWQSTEKWGDRLSASLINAHMTPEPSGSIPVFSHALSGIVLSPSYNELFCSFGYDAATLERECFPPGPSDKCLPGCVPPFRWFKSEEDREMRWCTDAELVDGSDHPCAWRPADTALMLQRREHWRARGKKPRYKVFDDNKFYNEMVFDAAAYTRHMPRSIEAVYYIEGDCSVNMGSDRNPQPMCKKYAIAAHANLIRHFNLTKEELPLVRFDPFDWTSPFSMPPAHFDEDDCDFRACTSMGNDCCAPAGDEATCSGGLIPVRTHGPCVRWPDAAYACCGPHSAATLAADAKARSIAKQVQ